MEKYKFTFTKTITLTGVVETNQEDLRYELLDEDSSLEPGESVDEAVLNSVRCDLADILSLIEEESRVKTTEWELKDIKKVSNEVEATSEL
jgi:hypothetical protein